MAPEGAVLLQKPMRNCRGAEQRRQGAAVHRMWLGAVRVHQTPYDGSVVYSHAHNHRPRDRLDELPLELLGREGGEDLGEPLRRRP